MRRGELGYLCRESIPYYSRMLFLKYFNPLLSSLMSSSASNPQSHPDSSTKRLYWFPYLMRYIIPIVVMSLIVTLCIGGFPSVGARAKSYDLEGFADRTPAQYIGSFRRDFNDLNDIQLSTAKNIGITPLRSRDDIAHSSRKMVEIATCDEYVVDELTHSIPYLIAPAARLLDEIGEEFTHYFRERGYPVYRPIVTSVTRSGEDLRRLRSSNGNASANSTHAYGTTFDISWKRFDKVDPADPRDIESEELKHILAIVLRKFHRDERCYIKHERQQACFHITVR